MLVNSLFTDTDGGDNLGEGGGLHLPHRIPPLVAVVSVMLVMVVAIILVVGAGMIVGFFGYQMMPAWHPSHPSSYMEYSD